MENQKFGVKIWGWVFNLLPALIIIALWINSKTSFRAITLSPYVSLSQALGLLALNYISLSFLLTTKLRFLEKIYDGVDNVYRTHRVFGNLGFSFVIAHYLLLVVSALPYWEVVRYYALPGEEWAMDFGFIALFLFILLIPLSYFRRISHMAWLNIHRIFGPAFIFASLHVLMIESDTTYNLALGLWTKGLMLVGLASFFYALFFLPPKGQFEG